MNVYCIALSAAAAAAVAVVVVVVGVVVVSVVMVLAVVVSLSSGFGGLEVACWPLVPKFAGSNPAEAVGFFGRKNPQHAFLRTQK
jgi:hypothetical protein